MRTHLSAATLGMAFLVSACGSASPAADAATTSTNEPAGNEGGFGAPSQAAGEFDPVQSIYTVSGHLRLDDVGCWGLDINGVERLVVLPPGFAIDSFDGTALVGPGGATFRDGDPVDASVRFFQATDVPGGANSRWGNYLAVCKPDLPELTVVDVIAPAFDPAELTVADHRDLISGAEFTEQWPCGRGWATSTADQRVGLVIYQIDEQAPGETLVLPNSGWAAELIIGKFLFANHCNDAIEEWMPEQDVVARFALSGLVTVNDPVPAPADPSSQVTATLSDGFVEIDGERLQLPPIELRNEAYNFFAG